MTRFVYCSSSADEIRQKALTIIDFAAQFEEAFEKAECCSLPAMPRRKPKKDDALVDSLRRNLY